MKTTAFQLVAVCCVYVDITFDLLYIPNVDKTGSNSAICSNKKMEIRFPHYNLLRATTLKY